MTPSASVAGSGAPARPPRATEAAPVSAGQIPAPHRSYATVPGLSDARRLPRIGRIRLGVKKKNERGKEYPVETDYFVIDRPAAAATPFERELYDNFTRVYGEKPKALDIILPLEEREAFFPQAYKQYGAAGLKCVGDGVTAVRLAPDGRFHDVESGCPGPDLCPFSLSNGLGGKPGCKFTASLFVLLPKVSLAGYFQIVSGSKTATISINSALDSIRQMFGRVSNLAYVDAKTGHPETVLRITRRPARIQYEGKAKVHFPVNVEPRITLDEYLRLRNGSSTALPALPLHDPPYLPSATVQSATVPSATVTPAPGTSTAVMPTQRIDEETGEILSSDDPPAGADGAEAEALNHGDDCAPAADEDEIEELLGTTETEPDLYEVLEKLDIPEKSKAVLRKSDLEIVRAVLKRRGLLQ